MKDIKHIRRDFNSATWVMLRGGTYGYWGGGGGLGGQIFFFPKFNQISCVSYLHDWHMHRHNFFGPGPLAPWGGVKNLFNFLNMVMWHIK